MRPRTPTSTLFPYTTLFRSRAPGRHTGHRGALHPARPAGHPTPGEGFLGIAAEPGPVAARDRKSTRLNSSHVAMSYAVFFLEQKMLPTQEIGVRKVGNSSQT